MKIIGASILAVAKDNVYGLPFFLLGRERHIQRYKDSLRYSDLGGTMQSGEQPEDTAAREFVEETAAMCKYFDDDLLPRSTHEDISRSLKQGHYLRRIIFCSGETAYITYVVNIPWDMGVIERHKNTYYTLAHCRYDALPSLLKGHPAVINVAGSRHRISKAYLEKSQLSWFSMPRMEATLSITDSADSITEGSWYQDVIGDTFRSSFSVRLIKMMDTLREILHM